MRAVVQRVLKARVTVDQATVSEIGPGLVVLLGVSQSDAETDAAYLAEKLSNLRVFNDHSGKMNHSVLALDLPVLVVSQFTLFGDCRKGRRPSYSEAAPPEQAEVLYQLLCQKLSDYGINVRQGRFRSQMVVELANDGPVTLLLDSQRQF